MRSAEYLFTGSEVTFVLASGGHNVGVVNPPGAAYAESGFQVATRKQGARHMDADTWAQRTPAQAGSWWPVWQRWVAGRSGAPEPPPALGNADAGCPPMGDAPGQYVLQR